MEFSLIVNALNLFRFVDLFVVRSLKVRLVCLSVAIVPFIIIHILMLMSFVLGEYPFRNVVIAIYFSFNGIFTTLRRFFYIYKKKEIYDLFQLFERPSNLRFSNFRELEAAMRVRSGRTIRCYCICIFSLTFVVLAVILLVIMSRTLTASPTDTSETERRMLLLRMWWPVDPRSSPSYFFVVAWQYSVLAAYLVTSCTNDAFLCALMLAAGERADFLARAAPRALLPGHGGKITPRFRAWVNYHQHYIKIVQRINQVTGPLIVITNFCAIITLIFFSFISIKMESRAVKAMSLIAALVTLLQLYATCRAGQHLTNKSVQLRNSVVGVAQVTCLGLQRLPFRSALQVLVTRLSGGARPESVSGMGYFNVSMQLFSSVFSAFTSYLFFLVNVKAKIFGLGNSKGQ